MDRQAFYAPLIPSNWKTLKRLWQEGYFEYVDLAFARLYHLQEDFACLLAFHLLLMRQGHLCSRYIEKEKTWIPSPKEVLLQAKIKEKGEYQEEDFEGFEALITQAMLSFESLKTKEGVNQEEKNPSFHLKVHAFPLVKEGQRLYLEDSWKKEALFVKTLKTFTNCQPSPHIPEKEVNSHLPEDLSEEQKQAIKASINCPLALITGGPGTGKTRVAGSLIKLLTGYSSLRKHKLHIALCAPTGKATQHLSKIVGETQKNLTTEFLTLHALLKENQLRYEQQLPFIPLPHDLIVVDESSMIDSDRMMLLFASLSPTTRVIMLGDPDQLPPVELGSSFQDLLDIKPLLPFAHSHLTRCFRAESRKLIELATLIKTGETLEGYFRENPGTFLPFNFDSKQDFLLQCLTFYEKLLPSSPLENIEDYLEVFEKGKILSSLRKGPLGLEACNLFLKKKLLSRLNSGNRVIYPIILKNNSLDKQLFNGEIGIFIYLNQEKGYNLKHNFALFKKNNGETIKVPHVLLPSFEWAFCLSIHKSQGSEFENVFITLPPGSELFGRELLYTGVTRAKKNVLLLAEKACLQRLLARQEKRFSGIEDKLINTLQAGRLG